jgi:photosystem II stability/assembly factor-like uncharacterized protein
MKKLLLALLILQSSLTVNICISQWVAQSSGTTSYLYSTHFENDLTGWATGTSALIKKTTNGGTNWFTQTSGQPFGAFNRVFFVDALTGWIVGDQVYTNTIILKTIDGGNNWAMQPGGTNRIFYSCHFLNSNTGWAVGMNSTLYVGLVVKTTDGGNTWNEQMNGPTDRFLSCFFLDSNTGWVGGVNSFAKTTNGGTNWTVIPIGTLSVNGLFFTDLLSGFMAENSSKIQKTTDGGLTWNISYTGNSSFRSVYFINPATGWACGMQGKIIKTTDAGTTWATQTTPITQDINSIHFVNPMIGYAVSSGGTILKTTNGGESPQLSTLTIHRYNINKPILMGQNTLDTISIITNNPAVGFVQDINVSLDTIVNNYDGELEISLMHLGVTDTIVYRVGGTGSNFYRTVLNDSALVPIESGTPPFVGQYRPSRPLIQFRNLPMQGIWMLRIFDRTRSLTGVIKSWGITITYSPNIGIGNTQNIIPEKCMLYQNYPNPFNPSTNIRYQITDYKFVSLKIFDLLGREVTTLVNEIQKRGLYETQFSVNSISGCDIPSGIYFYSLYVDGMMMDTKKFVLLK